MKECIVILGMHRSGTSVLSGLVSSQGFYLGESEMPKREDNPKGFFENMRVYRLNQKILEAYDTSWDNSFFTFSQIPPVDLYGYEEKAREIIKSEFGLVKRIFIKDPRMCLLFPLWEKVLQEMGFRIKVILAYRSPMEVAHSLKARNELAIEKSLMMWSHYFFQAEKTSRKYDRLIVHYNHDFADLDAFYELLGMFLEIELTQEMYSLAHDLYTPTLKHHRLQLDSLSSEVPHYLSDFISILVQEQLGNSSQLDDVVEDFYNSQEFYLYDKAFQVEEIKTLQESLGETEGELLLVKKNYEELSNQSKKKIKEVIDEASFNEKKLKKDVQDYDGQLKATKSELEGKLQKVIVESDKKLKELSLVSEKTLKAKSLEGEEKLRTLRVESEKQLKSQKTTLEDQLALQKVESEKQLKSQKTTLEDQLALQKVESEKQLKSQKTTLEEKLRTLRVESEKQLKTQKTTLEGQLVLQKEASEEQIALQKATLEDQLALQKVMSEEQVALQKTTLEDQLALQKVKARDQLTLQKADLEEQLALQKADAETRLNLKITTFDKKLNQQSQQANEKLKKASNESSRRLKEVRQCKSMLESLRRQQDVLKHENSTLRTKVKKKEEQLVFADGLFKKSHSSRKWSRKFGHLINGANYFKTRQFVIPFAKQRSKILWQDKAVIIESGLFSPFYYLTQNPDIWHEKVDPLNHFCNRGWKEGRNPSAVFNTQDYLSMYADVAKTGMNPLLHYIKFGIKEGRRPKIKASPKKLGKRAVKANTTTPPPSKQVFQQQHSGSPRGGIDAFDNGKVSGWFLSKDSLPLIKINGVPSQHTLDIDPSKQDIDFSTFAISSVKDTANVELFALNEAGVVPIHQTVFHKSYYSKDKYADIEMAYDLCQDPNAVAITVWEGAHNPIGRAKVLYDVLKTNRPVVIFAYVFGGFGDDLWGPLVASGLNIVLIPYEERLAYQSYIQTRKIKFNTVWICKHRLHSFELASLIAKPETACILDMDDNEDVFVSSKASELKPYGIFSKNKSNYFLKQISVRSVASVSLLENYGGRLMRHARAVYEPNTRQVTAEIPTAVFIGTIRPHKNITELVTAVATFNDTAPEKIKLALGGDFNPPSLRETLDMSHTIILDEVNNEDLYETLAQYDVLITGYPDEESNSAAINKYQITSKIGDGLAIGKPVLTPYSPAVEDLQDIPGLFVFRRGNFNLKLQEALNYKGKITLPAEFTLAHSYQTFTTLEAAARKESQAKNVFELEPFYNAPENKNGVKKNIVLVWKQHDAGVYGRRIDQIARYYKQENPDCNVTIVEAMSEKQINQVMSATHQFDSSTVIINEALSHKLYKYTIEGVDYRLISYNGELGWSSFEEKFNSYLSAEAIYPHNTVMILFPLHPVFDEIIGVLKNYKVIVDLVDNQIKWITTPEGRVKGLKQYYDLISIADEVVANSPQNIAYFKERGFFDGISPVVIPNWYTLPKHLAFERAVGEECVNLVYSGNLNDRIDWELLKAICALLAERNGYLHIAGSTIRRAEEMKDLLEHQNCVYHGVVNEQQLLRLLQHMNFAVIPHVEDSISKFMDPIKLKMYKKLGLRSLSTRLPGLPDNDPMLKVVDSSDAFLDCLDEMLEGFDDAGSSAEDAEVEKNYADIIETLLSKD